MKKTELLVDSAYEWIQNRVFDGTFQPGTKITTQEIADVLSISRTPVVAAINRLVAQGILTDVPHKGVMVAKMNSKQIRDFIDVRKMIEMYSVTPAINNVCFFPDILREMETYAEQLFDLSNDAYLQISRLENKYHSSFIKLTNNTQMLKLYESNWGVGFAVYTYIMAKMPFHDYQKSCEQHFLFVECLKTGDEKTLREQMDTHLNDVYKTLNTLM